MSRFPLFRWTVLLSAILFGVLIWPTPWAHQLDSRGRIVRINRLTGMRRLSM
jgi:hypothetical protein